jgi:integrase
MRRSIPKVEQRAWTADELRAFRRAAAGHRLFPAFWVGAYTGMRRNELLGLRWDDFDPDAATLSINRGLIAVAYELHETRGKTRNARQRIDLDPTTVEVLVAWRHWQQAELAVVGIDTAGWNVTDGTGQPIHPHAISQAFERIARRAGVPVIRLHDLRHTHGTLLIKAGVPVKVVSETLRPRHPRIHHRHVSARAGRHASRRRPHLRAARRAGASTVAQQPGECQAPVPA